MYNQIRGAGPRDPLGHSRATSRIRKNIMPGGWVAINRRKILFQALCQSLIRVNLPPEVNASVWGSQVLVSASVFPGAGRARTRKFKQNCLTMIFANF